MADVDARRSRWLRLAALVAVALLLLVSWRTGLWAQLREPAQLASRLRALGAWGYLAFVATYTALQPFGVPGTVFVMAAPLIWPWPIAFALSMVGTMAASVVGFVFFRWIGRDWVAGRIPARFQKYDEALARRGFVTVALLRFLFWMPQVLHAFFAVSRVGFWTHFWGSLVGYALPLLAVSYFGPRVLDWMRAAPAWLWLALAVLAGAIALTSLQQRRRRRRRAAHLADDR